MLEANDFRQIVKNTMGPVFETSGYEYNKKLKDMRWIKKTDDCEYQVGIGFFIDMKNPDPATREFRFTIFVDPKDIYDIRAYWHNGWPPKNVMKKLGIKPSVWERFISMGYDAWIPFPSQNYQDTNIWKEYAEYLMQDLDKKLPKAKREVKKTHRWGPQD